MRKILLSSVLLLSACVSNRMLFVEPKTNTPIYEAQCNAYNHTLGDCMAKAAETCPNGFITIKANDEVSGMMTSQDINTNITGNSSYNSHTFGGAYGNNLWANTNAFGNFNATANTSSLGGAQLQHKRSLIYACRSD